MLRTADVNKQHSELGVVIFHVCVKTEWKAVGMTPSVELLHSGYLKAEEW